MKVLMREKHIGWILMKTGKSSQILKGKTGEALFSGGKVQRVSGEIFPGTVTDPRTLDELALYAGYKNNGDAVIFGNLMPDGRICSFEDHKSTHGGFIGEMTEPFIITKNPLIRRAAENNNHMNHLFETIRSTRQNNKL